MEIKAVARRVIAAAWSLGTAAEALAVDGVAIEVGRSGKTDMALVAAQWQWAQRWLQRSGSHVGGYWEVSAARWTRDASPGQNSQLADFGVTPVFRWQANDLHGFYIEGGIGAHLISTTQLGSRTLSTAFQFGDHAGVGYRFGARGAADVSYRYQHLSNAGIKTPNQGLEAHQIRLQYWFD